MHPQFDDVTVCFRIHPIIVSDLSEVQIDKTEPEDLEEVQSTELFQPGKQVLKVSLRHKCSVSS